jgi:hypothetical protein
VVVVEVLVMEEVEVVLVVLELEPDFLLVLHQVLILLQLVVGDKVVIQHPTLLPEVVVYFQL